MKPETSAGLAYAHSALVRDPIAKRAEGILNILNLEIREATEYGYTSCTYTFTGKWLDRIREPAVEDSVFETLRKREFQVGWVSMSPDEIRISWHSTPERIELAEKIGPQLAYIREQDETYRRMYGKS